MMRKADEDAAISFKAYAARTLARKPSTALRSMPDWLSSSRALLSTSVAALPVADAAVVTPPIRALISLEPAATCWILRAIREFVRSGIAGVHLEDQCFPKRAHYHKYQVHSVPTPEFITKVKFACRARDGADPDFLIIARTDTCREFGLEEASDRINRAADVGADLGLLFPRNPAEAERAPKVCKLPLVYVMSRGNRDGRPIFTRNDLEQMGYVACIEAQVVLLPAFVAQRKALKELRATGGFTQLTEAEMVRARKDVEDLIGLDEYYAIEAETVEHA